MPAIAKVTLPSGVKYIATYRFNDTRHYDGHIIAIDKIKRSMSTDHGGFCKWKFGSFDFVPTLFEDDWPPPDTFTLDWLKFTDTTEGVAVYLGDGTLKLEEISRQCIKYELYPQEYSDTVNTQAYNDTLDNIFTAACATLGLTFNNDSARAVSPAIVYTTGTSDTLLIDELSNMAAWKSHYFYVDDGTLYLIDMLLDNGTQAVTEFDILPSSYSNQPGYSLFKGGDYSVAGTDALGSEYDVSPVCHNVEATILIDLGNIKTVVERIRPVFRMPIEIDQIPVIGKRMELTDESKLQSLDVWARVSGISFNIDEDTELMIVEGVGAIS